jgi:Bacteriophage protein gp37
MSDLFHEDVPEEFIQEVFEIMRKASWHTFQVLNKTIRKG